MRYSSTSSVEKDVDVKAELVGARPKSLPARAVELVGIYLSLGKFRLSALVILTTMAGYAMAPAPFLWGQFLYSSFATTLAAMSANSINQWIEIEHDSKMKRTGGRPLPSGRISAAHAITFGITSGAVGCGLLYFGTNGLSSALALSTILLYTCVYTPFKRVHPINTWIGSVVGAIPPMIGWAAATGGLEPGAWALALLLYVWQIPHFLALSWGLRHDYAKAGYQMLSSLRPDKLPTITLRWSVYLAGMGAVCAASGMTDWWFAVDSTLASSHMLYCAGRFYRDSSNPNARKLFFSLLWWLPLFCALMFYHKKDWRSATERSFALPESAAIKPDAQAQNS